MRAMDKAVMDAASDSIFTYPDLALRRNAPPSTSGRDTGASVRSSEANPYLRDAAPNAPGRIKL
jgi:hypothetical protein